MAFSCQPFRCWTLPLKSSPPSPWWCWSPVCHRGCAKMLPSGRSSMSLRAGGVAGCSNGPAPKTTVKLLLMWFICMFPFVPYTYHCWDCSDQIGISNHINENKNRTFEGDKDSNRSLLKEHTSPSLNFARCSVQTLSVSDSIYGNMSCKTTRGLVSLVVIFRKRSIWIHGWHCKTAGCPIDFQEILDKCMA
jgi:hypothetical protein